MNKELCYTMELQGEGILMVEPDIAVVNLGVETMNKELKLAQEENARIMQRIILSLKRMGISDQDIQTQEYSINKQYDYVDGRQIDRGYVVRNILRITIKEIGSVGEVIDAAVESGANVVRGVTFEIEDPSHFYQQALNLALVDAQGKAMSLANQMGVQVLGVPLRIVEESYSQVPFSAPFLARAGDAQTPIETGQKQVVAKIKVVFSYALVS